MDASYICPTTTIHSKCRLNSWCKATRDSNRIGFVEDDVSDIVAITPRADRTWAFDKPHSRFASRVTLGREKAQVAHQKRSCKF